MAIDGDPATAWTVGEHADPVGETLRLHFDQPVPSIGLVQTVAPGGRRITAVTVQAVGGPQQPQRVELTDASLTSPGQAVALPAGAADVDITIAAVGGGEPSTASAVAGVGFAEIVTGMTPTIEVVRVPSDALEALGSETPLTVALDPPARRSDGPLARRSRTTAGARVRPTGGAHAGDRRRAARRPPRTRRDAGRAVRLAGVGVEQAHRIGRQRRRLGDRRRPRHGMDHGLRQCRRGDVDDRRHDRACRPDHRAPTDWILQPDHRARAAVRIGGAHGHARDRRHRHGVGDRRPAAAARPARGGRVGDRAGDDRRPALRGHGRAAGGDRRDRVA